MLVDAEKESGGVWVNYDPETRFLIGSITSRRFKTEYNAQLEAIRIKSRGRKVSPEDAEELQTKVYASAIVLGWEGVTKDSQPFSCTPENAYYLLKNCPQVRDFVTQTATEIENFKAEFVEEAKAATGEA